MIGLRNTALNSSITLTIIAIILIITTCSDCRSLELFRDIDSYASTPLRMPYRYGKRHQKYNPLVYYKSKITDRQIQLMRAINLFRRRNLRPFHQNLNY